MNQVFKLSFSFIAAFILLLSNGFSQETWTLEECIQYALENNLQIKQAELSKEREGILLKQSQFERLPSLNGFASHSYNFGRTVDPFTNEFATERVQSNNFSMNSRLNIFNGFQRLNTIKRNRANLASSNYELEELKNDVSLNIANLYLQILFNRELLANAMNQKEVSEIQKGRISKMVEIGNLPQGSLLDIEAQIAAEELQIIQAQNQLDLSKLNLSQMMGVERPEDFQVAAPDIETITAKSELANPEGIYDFALQNMPEIKSAEFQILSAEKNYSIAKGGMSPSLSMNGSIGTGYSGARQELIGYTVGPDPQPIFRNKPFDTQLEENINYTIGLSLNIPIFNGWGIRSNIKQSQLNIESMIIALEEEKRQLWQNIQSAHQDAVAALKSYNAAEKSVLALEESFGYTQERFDVGLVNSFDYNNEKNKLINAQSELLQAKYEFIFKTQVLNFYQGNKISLK